MLFSWIPPFFILLDILENKLLPQVFIYSLNCCQPTYWGNERKKGFWKSAGKGSKSISREALVATVGSKPKVTVTLYESGLLVGIDRMKEEKP